MYRTDPLLIEKCRALRRQGFTLGKIMKVTGLPKVTIYDHIRDIPLSTEIKKKIIKEAIQRLYKFSQKRKGKCIPGRIVPKPERWSNELIYLIAHFMFDGEIQTNSCIYHNRSEALSNRVSSLMKKVFNLQPRNSLNEETGVYRISYHYVELADYMRGKAQALKKYIRVASLSEKMILLRAFFDDEGSVGHWGRKRLVRGFQHNLEILRLIQKLLKDFNIESKIDEKYKEIVISRKPNLIKFRNKINFSKGVSINPHRKNSIWKKKLEKRKILDYILSTYKN